MTCRKSDKEITVYDAQGNCTRTLKALEDPLQVGYCTDAALFIVAEKHKLALWDTRMATCVKRLSVIFMSILLDPTQRTYSPSP